MCPACVSLVAWWITGGVSAGGILAIGVKRRKQKKAAVPASANGQNHGN